MWQQNGCVSIYIKEVGGIACTGIEVCVCVCVCIYIVYVRGYMHIMMQKKKKSSAQMMSQDVHHWKHTCLFSSAVCQDVQK